MRRFALLLAFLPPAASTLACECPEQGSPVELAPETVAKNPSVAITGDATVECAQRRSDDRCEVYWIVPHAAGSVTFTLVFPDGTSSSDTIDYIADSQYPCRGDFRPIHDHVTHL